MSTWLVALLTLGAAVVIHQLVSAFRTGKIRDRYWSQRDREEDPILFWTTVVFCLIYVAGWIVIIRYYLMDIVHEFSMT